jgi:hypothetical protein
MKRRTRSAVAVTAALVGSAFVGCNAILDNRPAEQLVTEEAGTEPRPHEDSGARPSPPSANDDSGAADAQDDGATQGCPGGRRMCNGVCVDRDDPLYGCGDPACGACAPDHATAVCRNGRCAVAACDHGYADCNGIPDDGCEGDLSKATSCGACNAVCPPTAPLCAPAGATFQCTNGCTPAAPLLCGNDCVDPLTSVNHCGACNAKCAAVANATVACVAGACTFTCKAGFHACGAKCVQNTDPQACGAACVVCAAPANARATCVADACSYQCNGALTDCPGVGCVELKNDPLNCGACGTSCAGQPCQNGVCKPAPVDAGDGG